MYKSISRILKNNQSTGVLTRFDGNVKQYVRSDTESTTGVRYEQVYRNSKTGASRSGLPLRNQQSVQGTDGVSENQNLKSSQFDIIQAEEYAGGRNSKVYSKTVPLTDVAWINGDEGQFANVENGSTVYVVDSSKDNKISFGVIKEIAIDDAQLLKTNVEEINERAIRERNICDELFERIRYSSDNNSRVGIERQLSKELSTDTGKPEYNKRGISRSDGNRGVYSGTEQSVAETKVKQKLSREIDQSDFEADIRYFRESATIEDIKKENKKEVKKCLNLYWVPRAAVKHTI